MTELQKQPEQTSEYLFNFSKYDLKKKEYSISFFEHLSTSISVIVAIFFVATVFSTMPEYTNHFIENFDFHQVLFKKLSYNY